MIEALATQWHQVFSEAGSRMLLASVVGLSVFYIVRRIMVANAVTARITGPTEQLLPTSNRLSVKDVLRIIPPLRFFQPDAKTLRLMNRLRWNISPNEYARLRLLVMILGAILGYRVASNLGALAGILIGLWAPGNYLRFADRKRTEQLIAAFPQFVDFLRVHLATGMNIPQAVRRTVRHLRGPMYEEVTRLIAEIEVYGDFEQPFRAFGERCGFVQAQQLAESLIHGWNSGMRTNIFAQQAQLVRDIRRLAIRRAIRQAPIRIVAIPGTLALLNIVLILGVSLFTEIFQALAFAFGTGAWLGR